MISSQNTTSKNRLKNGNITGIGVYMSKGTTLRVTVANRNKASLKPDGRPSPKNFGYNLICNNHVNGNREKVYTVSSHGEKS